MTDKIAAEIADLRNDKMVMDNLDRIRDGLRRGDPTDGFDVVAVRIETLKETYKNHTFVGLDDDEILRFLGTAYAAEF